MPLGEAMHFRWLRNGNQGIELVQMANSQPVPSAARRRRISTCAARAS